MKSLAHPGGNITGFHNYEPALGSKWLEALKVVAPSVRRVAVVHVPEIAANVAFIRAGEASSKALGVTVMRAGVRDAADIESVLSDFARGPNGGLIVTPSPLTATRRDHRHCVATELASDLFVPFLRSKRWVDLIRNRPARNRARSSVLRQSHLAWRESRQFTSTIATKYQLIINLRTAKALGLRPSESFLKRADEVIE